MKKIIITALFISMVSFVFANGIKKQTIKTKDTQKIEVVKQVVPNTVKDIVSKPNPNIWVGCGVTLDDGRVVVTATWGLTEDMAKRRCSKRLNRVLEKL